MKKLISKYINKLLEQYAPRGSWYLWNEVQKRYTEETVQFIHTEMKTALFCMNPFDVLSHAIENRKPGVIAEFGVFSGKTINHMSSMVIDQTLYGFDSFEGLPEQWTGFIYARKMFDVQGNMPKVNPNVKLIKGWFDATVPPFFKDLKEPVSILHLDADIYSSTKTVLDAAIPHIQNGTILAFDEFFNYPGYQLHEYKAFYEFIAETGWKYEFLAYSGNQLSVRLFK